MEDPLIVVFAENLVQQIQLVNYTARLWSSEYHDEPWRITVWPGKHTRPWSQIDIWLYSTGLIVLAPMEPGWLGGPLGFHRAWSFDLADPEVVDKIKQTLGEENG